MDIGEVEKVFWSKCLVAEDFKTTVEALTAACSTAIEETGEE
jgi:hypothetical protein